MQGSKFFIKKKHHVGIGVWICFRVWIGVDISNFLWWVFVKFFDKYPIKYFVQAIQVINQFSTKYPILIQGSKSFKGYHLFFYQIPSHCSKSWFFELETNWNNLKKKHCTLTLYINKECVKNNGSIISCIIRLDHKKM